jgi:hypothetical protein
MLVADLPRFLRQLPEAFRLASRSLGRRAVFLGGRTGPLRIQTAGINVITQGFRELALRV